MSLFIFAMLCLVCGATGYRDNITLEWKHWLDRYGYHGNEELYDMWAENMEYIESHNSYPGHTYTLAMNHFGTLRRQEFVSAYQCVGDVEPVNAEILNSVHNTTVFIDHIPKVGGDLPSSMDWRTSGAVTKVKDQLRCGSSYAFSSMGALEGIHALAYRELVTLSEQNIVDCSGPYGNYGCACGEVNKALLYVIDNGGVDTWNGYPSGGHPYRSKQYACAYDPAYRGAGATGVVVLKSGDEQSLLSAVATMGPVSVYVDATSTAFQFYSEGVMDIPYCSTNKLSHALLVIGYGSSGSGGDYWLVKNSWGPNWGVWGYGLMARNKNNHCGIATSASLPTL